MTNAELHALSERLDDQLTELYDALAERAHTDRQFLTDRGIDAADLAAIQRVLEVIHSAGCTDEQLQDDA